MCHLGKIRVLYIILFVTISSILTQLIVKKKGVYSRDIHTFFLFDLQNPQFISNKMVYVLC